MKKIFFILIFLLCSISVFYAQKIGEKVTTPFGKINAISVLEDDRIFVGTVNEGLFYSPDYGSTWIQLTFPTTKVGMVYKTSKGDLFVDADFDGLYRLKNETGYWELIGFKDVKVGKMFESSTGNLLMTLSSYNQYVYYDPYLMYISKDDGSSWKYVNSAFSTYFVEAESKHPNGKLFIGSAKGVYKSEGGEYWSYCHPGTVSNMTILSDGTIYIALSDDTDYRVSGDEGANWSVIPFTENPFTIGNIFHDKQEAVYIYVNTSTVGELYKKQKNSSQWIKLGELNGNNTYSFGLTMQINSRGDIFYLDYDTLYKIGSNITEVKNNEGVTIPNNYSLSQNYPNPFNPTTRIKYSIPQKSFVRLSVFDILGREVAALVNSEKEPGYYEIEFDGSKLSSGVYFYKLQSGSFSQTKKFMLVK